MGATLLGSESGKNKPVFPDNERQAKRMSNGIFSMEGKCAVIFGGAGYLGSATVKAMAELGAKVVIADTFPEYTKINTDQFIGNPNIVMFKSDISDPASIRAAYDKCLESFGAFNTMLNLSVYGKATSLENSSDEEWASSMDGVIGSSFRVIREVIPYFKKNEKSVIVNTASMYGLVSPDYRIYGTSGQNSPPAYGAGKAAVAQLTRYAAAHLAKYNIRVNCVTPGPFPDDRKLPPADFLQELSNKTMLGRVGTNKEIAGAFCYLASEASSFTTGSNVIVDGGWTAW